MKRTPLKRSVKPIRRATEKKQAQYKEIARIKGGWQKERRLCFFCQRKPFRDPVHIVRRSYSDDLYTNIENLIPGCGDCHTIFDDKPGLVHTLGNIDVVLERMKKLDESYYNRFIQRMEEYA